MTQNASPETQKEAMKVAKATQKPNQTKEQTKLIAQGIEKGISEYKKQQKAKARERDKQRKQALKNKATQDELSADNNPTNVDANLQPTKTMLPWVLLVVSWCLFLGYFITLK